MKKILINLIALFSILNIFACSKDINNDANVLLNIKNAKAVTEYDETTALDEFDTVFFGKYPQSDINGNKKDNIEWIVLKKDEKEAVLLSKYILEHRQFEKSGSNFSFSDSSLKEWLTTEFFKDAFSNTNIIKDNEISILDEKLVERNKVKCLKTTNTNFAKRYYEKVTEKDFTWYRQVDNFTGDNNIDLSYYKVIVGAEIDGRQDQDYKPKYNFPTDRGPYERGKSGYLNSDNPKYNRYNAEFYNEHDINVTWGLRDGYSGTFYDNSDDYLTVVKDDDKYNGGKNLNFFGVRPVIVVNLNANDTKNDSTQMIKKSYDVKEILRNILTIDKFSDTSNVSSLRTVKFGKYKVDGKEEDLTWIVLERNENRALLLSQYAIDEMEYNSEKDIDGLKEQNRTDWERSKIREYLNYEFINTSFNSEEREMIKANDLVNSGEIYVLNEETGQYLFNDSYNSNATLDKVFILSIDEIVKFFDGEYDNEYLGSYGVKLPKKINTSSIQKKIITIELLGGLEPNIQIENIVQLWVSNMHMIQNMYIV